MKIRWGRNKKLEEGQFRLCRLSEHKYILASTFPFPSYVVEGLRCDYCGKKIPNPAYNAKGRKIYIKNNPQWGVKE